MIKSNFLNILRKFENSNGHKLSLREFCRLTGISRSVASRLFNNKVNGLKFDTLDKLVKFFQVPPSKFVNYIDKPLRMVLYNADSFSTNSTIDRCGLEAVVPHSEDSNGIAITFSGYKSPVHIVLVPTFPLYPSETGFGDFLFYFAYQIFSDNGVLDNFPSFKLSYNKRFRYIFNHNITLRLQRYISSRMLLHSGFVKHNDGHKISVNGYPVTSEFTDISKYYLHFNSLEFKNANELFRMWSRQPNEYDTNHDKYKLISSNVGQPIKIHDYTTNNFAK